MARLEHWETGERLWKEFGFGSKASIRQQMLALTVIRVGELGVNDFSTNALAKELKTVPANINYHFGSREGLLAEASVLGYKRYVERTWEMVQHETDPEKRLRTWLDESTSIQFEMHGWGPIFNYPSSFANITNIVNSKFKGQMEDLSELNMARLLYLVEDLKLGKVREFPFELKKIPRAKLMTNPKLTMLVGSIGWSNLGMSVWYAGRHLPTKQLSLKSTFTKQMMKYHIDQMIVLVKNS